MDLNEAYELYRSNPCDETMEVLYPLVKTKVKGVVRWMLRHGDPDEALVVSITTDVLIEMDQFKGDAAFSTWVERIARHDALDEARRRLRAPLHSFDDDGGYINRFADIDDPSYSTLLGQVLGQLNLDEQVLLTGKLEQASSKELAEILGVTPEVVWKRWERLREKCQVLVTSDAQRIESETLPNPEIPGKTL